MTRRSVEAVDSTADQKSAFRVAGLLLLGVDWVFGYDFFISYSHADGKNYPRRLKERLEKAGFRAFFDQTDYVPGADLPVETRRQVRKSRSLVVIGRSAALSSPWVQREVDAVLAQGRRPIIVDVNGAVEAAPETASVARAAREKHWLRLLERIDTGDGEPSDRTIAELQRGFHHTRQEENGNTCSWAYLLSSRSRPRWHSRKHVPRFSRQSALTPNATGHNSRQSALTPNATGHNGANVLRL